jgi:hypothetical protein
LPEIISNGPYDAPIFGTEDLAGDIGATRIRDYTNDEGVQAVERVLAARERTDAGDRLVVDLRPEVTETML